MSKNAVYNSSNVAVTVLFYFLQVPNKFHCGIWQTLMIFDLKHKVLKEQQDGI